MTLRSASIGLLAAATLLGGCSDDSLTRINFGRTALVTGDFDTVEQLIQEVANTTAVQAEIQHYNGYIDGPHYSNELPDERDPGQRVEDLLRGEASDISRYDTVFFSCGMRGVGEFRYNGVQEDDQIVRDGTAVQNVVEAARRGSDIYFSDWTYDLLEAAFPDKIDWLGEEGDLDAAQRGRAGDVVARVASPDLAEAMGVAVGSELEIRFNQSGWAVIDSVAADVEVLVSGDISYDDPDTGLPAARNDVPLVVSFEHEGGTVVFTAFHNEAQITDDARNVLRFQLQQLGS